MHPELIKDAQQHFVMEKPESNRSTGKGRGGVQSAHALEISEPTHAARITNKLDLKNFKWSQHNCGSAKRGIQDDSKVAKKMVMCFHFVKG